MNKKIFKIKPIFIEKIWGGDNLKELYQHKSTNYNLGEVWLFSAIDAGDSTVETNEGNCLLSKFFEKYSEELGVDNMSLPKIQLRLVDCMEDLSLQVHPDDQMAQLNELENGKDETWLVLKTEDNSKLIMGCDQKEAIRFKTGGDVEKLYEKSVEYCTNIGDIFHINSGMLHALGKNNFVLEISQPSNTTYRVFDYNRKDNEGEFRELHLDKSREAINPYVENTPITTKNIYISGNKVQKTTIQGRYSFEKMEINGLHSFNSNDKYRVVYVHECNEMTINNETVKNGDTYIAFKEIDIRIEGSGKVVVAYE